MTKDRVNYISACNVISAIAVIILHANASFWSYSDSGYWAFSNVVECVFYFAVPVFFMLTGATLIDYRARYSTKEYFKKRFIKTVIPFVFWSVFAMLWSSRKVLWALVTGRSQEGPDWTFLSVADGILNTKFLQIYWFFVPLFCIYLIIPLFAAVQEKLRVKMFTYIVGISLPLNFAVPFATSLLKRYAEIDFRWTYTVFVGFQYLFYVLAGYVVHKRDIKLRYRLIIYAVSLAGLLTHILGSYFESRAHGSLVTFYKGYYNLPCVLYSTGMFVFLKYAAEKIKSPRINRFFIRFQGYTFPIYLIHRYFLDVFEENVHLIGLDKASVIYIVSATAGALILSVLMTMLLRRIPLLRRVIP